MYDYVIVGGGSAGCVLAARLSEDPNIRVLLLEAGITDDRCDIHVPAATVALWGSPIDWDDHTEPQPHLGGRCIRWPHGKVLGGSSAINVMMYMRGHRQDYDRWAELGNPGWSWDDVLFYFRRAENQERGASEHHGVGGPLHVGDPKHMNPLSEAFLRAGAEIGLPRSSDFNGGEPSGVGVAQATIRRGRRCSAATAYLEPARRRRNLEVRTGAQALRLVEEGGRVSAVEYRSDVGPGIASAALEVIVSAGSINTPALLMRSGIGPGAHLRDLGIPVIRDLRGVGENLHDHPLMPVVYSCTRPVTLESARTAANVFRYLVFRRGALASNGAETAAFVSSDGDGGPPDLEVILFPAQPPDWYTGLQEPIRGSCFSILASLIRPRSRGFVRLRSPDPSVPPRIQPNYLGDARDLAVAVAAVKICRRLARAKAFDPFRGREHVPGEEFGSDAEIAGAVRRHLTTSFHPVGTCAMGNGPMSVVDARLRVRGLVGLRVVDGSIIPEIVSGNTNAPIIMIAEKASDLIREDSRG